MTSPGFRRIAYLSGGVGGARLLEGLRRVVDPSSLTAIVNTGDDFRHLGLHIAPDLDTILYTLSGLGHEERGWGLFQESFEALSMVRRYGGPDWFLLGDRDLATHLLRTEALGRGERFTDVTARLAGALGVNVRMLPMSDAPRPTRILTAEEGELSFQDWFVRRRAQPSVRSVAFGGEGGATPEVLEAIRGADLVVIGPSNPYVSIEPILVLEGVREALQGRPVVAVSPIVGGAAVKGPLAEMLRSIDHEEPSVGAIARRYPGLLTGLLVEHGDEEGVPGVAVRGARTVMKDAEGRVSLGRELLAFAASLG